MRTHKTTLLLIGVVLIGLVALSISAQETSIEDANRQLIEAYAQAELDRNYELMDEYLAEDFVRHSTSSDAPVIESRDAFKAFLQETAAIFPDYVNTIQMMVVDESMIAAQVTFRGTFVGNNQLIEFPLNAFWRIEDGRLAELWVNWNDLVMLPQMGLLPSFEELMAPPFSATDIIGTWQLRQGGFYIQYNEDGTYRLDTTIDGLNSDNPDDVGVYTIQNSLQIFRSGADTQSCSLDQVSVDQLELTGEGILKLTQVLDTCSWRSTSSSITHQFVRIETE